MKIGYIGLGKMGKNMVLRLLEQGVSVVTWNRSPEPLDEVKSKGAQKANSLSDLVGKLSPPRIIWLMLPNGPIIDEIIDQLLPLLTPGDLLIDGGNSYYKDSIRRFTLLYDKNIRFLDIGVSGGPSGARNGACLMVGGNKKDYEEIIDLIKAASAPNAYGYVGLSGAGHFVKMIHNGIEYGMMESIAEGAAILKKSAYQLNLAEVFGIYNNKSVIESRLVGWTKDIFDEDQNLPLVSSKIDHTGEGEWTIQTATELSIDTPAIKASLTVRKKSDTEPENFRNKVVSALRGKFGQHKTTKD